MTHEDKIFYTSIGICPKCAKYEIIGNEKYCIECRSKDAEYKMQKYESDQQYRENHIKTVVNNKKERRRLRREKGLCIECGKRKPKTGIATCEWCREKANKKKRDKYKNHTTRKNWVDKGLCFLCGSECESGYKVCQRHHIMYIENAQTINAKQNRKEQKRNGFLSFPKII